MGSNKIKSLYVTEPVFIPDTFATGMLPLENRGDFLRVTYFAERTDYHPDGAQTPERLVVARIIMPRAALVEAATMARMTFPELQQVLKPDS